MVAAPAAGGGGFAVLLDFYSGPQPCISARGKPACTAPPTVPPPTNVTVKVAGASYFVFA